MKPADFDKATFTVSEVDCAWHVYAALLSYSLYTPGAKENPNYAAALEQQKFMFDMMFERLEQ